MPKKGNVQLNKVIKKGNVQLNKVIKLVYVQRNGFVPWSTVYVFI